MITKTTQLASAFEALPDGVTEAETIRAAAQFLNQMGTAPETVDLGMGILVSRPMVGQTLLSNCGVNAYRSYVAHVTASAGRLTVTLDCTGSFGWEEHVDRGVVMAAHREQVGPCSEVSEYDGQIPRLLAVGTLSVLNVARGQQQGGAPK